MKALILAAGKGTRLGDLTQKRPKPMLPVGDKPLLEHLVLWLRTYGITQIAMNLHHAPQVITDYFGAGQEWDVTIHYSHEKSLLGTAGAAKRLESFLDEPFVVVYGDVLTNINLADLIDFHAAQRATCRAPILTLALYRVPNPTECGLVEIDGSHRVQRFVEKPPADQVFTDLANAGVLVVEPELLSHIPVGEPYDFGHDLFPRLLAAGVPLFGMPIADHEYVIDIGTPAGYARAQSVVMNEVPYDRYANAAAH